MLANGYSQVPLEGSDDAAVELQDVELNSSGAKDVETTVLYSTLNSAKQVIRLPATATIAALKEKLDFGGEDKQPEDTDIHLIYMGRKLEDDETVSSTGIDQGTVHCLFMRRPDPNEQKDEAVIQVEEAEGINFLITQQDIELQQRWDQQNHRDGLPSGATVGTQVDFAVGLLMGILLGFIALLWVWQWRVSRKKKMGILLGIVINLIFSFTNDDSEDEEDGLTSYFPVEVS